MTKKRKLQNGWTIEALERVSKEKPRSLSHAWIIGSAKKQLEQLNNYDA